jgi:hypothetical protein
MLVFLYQVNSSNHISPKILFPYIVCIEAYFSSSRHRETKILILTMTALIAEASEVYVQAPDVETKVSHNN